MSAFDVVCPVKKTSCKTLVAKAREISPVSVEKNDKVFLLNSGDIVTSSFYWGPKTTVQIKKFKPIATVETLHRFDASVGCYWPTTAEVLIQISDEVKSLKGMGVIVVAFSNEPSLGVVEEARLLRVEGQPSERALVGRTTLYSGEMPKKVAERPIQCRGISYAFVPKK